MQEQLELLTASSDSLPHDRFVTYLLAGMGLRPAFSMPKLKLAIFGTKAMAKV